MKTSCSSLITVGKCLRQHLPWTSRVRSHPTATRTYSFDSDSDSVDGLTDICVRPAQAQKQSKRITQMPRWSVVYWWARRSPSADYCACNHRANINRLTLGTWIAPITPFYIIWELKSTCALQYAHYLRTRRETRCKPFVAEVCDVHNESVTSEFERSTRTLDAGP